MRQHTDLIYQMTKLYGSNPGWTHGRNMGLGIPLAQIVEARIGEYLITNPVWGSYYDFLWHLRVVHTICR